MENERKLSRQTRRKMAMVAKRTAKKRAAKKKIRAKRMKSPAQLKVSAEKAAKKFLVKRMTGGKPYNDLSVSQKELVDKKIDARKGLIGTIAKKMLPLVKKKEKERLKRLKNKGKVGDTSLFKENFAIYKRNIEGGEVNLSGYKKDNKILPSKFDTKQKAKNHSKKVGGKVIADSNGNYYVEFTKIDGPMKENKDKENELKDLKSILDVAKLLSDKSPYFKGRGSKKEYIKMLVHKIKKLSEAKQKKLISKIDAYNKVRKPTLPKSRAMKSKKTYDRKDFKKGKYD
jgi:hypothetical protein